MVLTEKTNQLLDNYKTNINIVVDLFIANFGVKNPTKKWRNELIPRTGYLDKKKSIEYSLHGAGCTVEFANEKIVSFDFDKDDKFVLDKYKFWMFVNSSNESKEVKDYVEDLINSKEWQIEQQLESPNDNFTHN
jgi:hypothetical protein